MGQLDRTPEDLGPLALFGCVLSGIGLAFEAIGDWQMARFRADPVNKGRVINKGLWRNTRHPNYFGDTCVWWGLYLIAAETTTGLFSIPGPILITYLLVGLTGAAMLERNLGDRAHKRASLRPINAIL
jgi:steroid 5-alpha reductase family enzyme